MKPLVGITCSRIIGGAWGTYSPGHFMDYCFEEYTRAILTEGGLPVILPAVHDHHSLTELLASLDGLLLSGGPDINPMRYGANPEVGLGEVDDGLDHMELAAARIAVNEDLPVLGICRGIQILNVACGGTLHQDIPSCGEKTINHNQTADKSVLTHTVTITPHTLLHRIMGAEQIRVNGKHHQALKKVGEGLVVTAQAPDDVVEAVENPAKPFLLGVQWHPEGTWASDRSSQKLFKAFVKAASTYGQTKSSPNGVRKKVLEIVGEHSPDR